eukprot:6484721-Amphidinium_carterae.1
MAGHGLPSGRGTGQGTTIGGGEGVASHNQHSNVGTQYGFRIQGWVEHQHCTYMSETYMKGHTNHKQARKHHEVSHVWESHVAKQVGEVGLHSRTRSCT